MIKVRDHGEGFDPEQLPDPLAPENLLKASGRGIFFMRSFMDDVQIARAQRRRDGSAHGEALHASVCPGQHPRTRVLIRTLS